ncbi:MAG: hypothetical protein KAI17_22915 [Thiotrichaceae bacterium]|nr:hypothetical protein [Thiotrichaceae bacterium]
MTKTFQKITTAFLIAISFTVALCISNYAISGGIKMDDKTIKAFNETPTAQDTREASALAQAVKDKYMKAESTTPNGQLVIFYKAKRSKIYLYIFEKTEAYDQDKLVKIIDGQRDAFTKKTISILFYAQQFSESSDNGTKQLLREVEL